MQRLLLFLIAFGSGVSALVCESAWNRMLVPVFGNTVFATGMVAAVFMTGLGLGGWWGGAKRRWLADRRRALAAYAVMEAGVGIFALAFPMLNAVLAPLHLELIAVTAGQRWLADLIRLIFFTVLLLPPTFLMGASFPAIGTAFVEDPQRAGRDSAFVYGINTLGGTVGALAAGFWLIRAVGGRHCLSLAGGLSLVLALAAQGVARAAQAAFAGALPRAAARKTRPAAAAMNALPAATVRMVLFGAGLAGFCALAYEVIWTRLLVLVLQNSVYAFALILAGFLAGIGFGSLLLAPLVLKRSHPLPAFGLFQVLFDMGILAVRPAPRSARVVLAGAGVVLAAAGAFWLPPDLVQRQYVKAAAGEEPLYYAEGRVATASITRNREGNRILYLNGIPEVTNDRPALKTFRLMALLPFVLHPAPKDAVMITFGAGISAGLAVRLFERVACVDLNERCPEIARHYERENHNVLEAPNLTLHIDDGRNFLLRDRSRHSAIIADATHPHSYDSWILFTREFYRLCRSRLDEEGLFCQWLPLHGLAPRQFATILNTVRHAFAEAGVWVVDGAYCLIVAGEKPLRMDPRRLATVLSRPDLRPLLSPVGLDNPYAVLAGFVTARKGLERMLARETSINIDDRPYNQFFPLSVTGFGRLRWHVDNLRQLMPFRQKWTAILETGQEAAKMVNSSR